MQNPFDQDDIYFDDDLHLYFHKSTGRRLISPTTILKKYSHPFDPDGKILAKCAAREGVKPEELKAKWRKMGDDSVVRGHSIHDSFEQYVKTGQIQKDGNEDIIQDFKERVQVDLSGKLYPEVTLFDLDFGIAGRTDLVHNWWGNIVDCLDFKTNKKGNISKYSFGKFMYAPLQHIPDAKFFHYELQLSMYSFMLESKGYCPRNLALLWINPERKIEKMPLQYRRNDVVNMLKHYHENKK